jgi:DNA-binding NtrC family response regulator/tetratricopeptide (TPR) repeat protein
MQLVADRFAVDADGRAIDLASAEPVVLTIGSAGGVSDQIRWSGRCATLSALHHHALAPLVDFGLVGEASRFEAWSCGLAWCGARTAAVSARDVVTRVLLGSGLSAGPIEMNCVRQGPDGSATVLPDASTGYPRERAAGDGNPERAALQDVPICDRGLATVDRLAVSALAEMLEARSARPHVSAIWGPPGVGKRTVVRGLARIARARGFVPIDARLVMSRYAELWRGRSLFIIANDTGAGGARPWSALLDATLRGPQPHVLLLVGQEEWRAIDGVAIGRLMADALIAALRPQAMSARAEQTVRRAAERARGLPGRFIRLLRQGSIVGRDQARRARRGRLSRVAEQTAVYGGEEVSASPFAPPPAECAWPAPGELAALRRKRDAAVAHLAQGRHAPGVRQLRQAMGGLARRGDWTDAADAALVLASALLRRGRPRDALAAINHGRELAGRAGHDAMLLDLAMLAGHAWIDLARLDDAEGALGAALAAARLSRDPVRIAAASTALARCLFWRGQYTAADAALAGPADFLSAGAPIQHALLASRIAIGLRDLPRAMRLVADVAASGGPEADAATQARIACAMAFAHLAAGETAAVERDVSAALEAARAAHDPLRGVRAQILRAEALRRSGRAHLAVAQLQRLRRVAPALPPVVRARWELCAALAGGHAEPHDLVARRAAATGLGALALYASDREPPAHGVPGADAFLDEVVGIVRVCQTAEDETIVLKEVCARVRRQLRASAVAFVEGGDRGDVVALDGARIDVRIAARAVTAAITIAPHRHEDRIEAAAPVHYGGVPIGALCARWTLGSTDDLSRAAPVLTMSAAAAAPVLSAATIRRQQAMATAPELLGVTPAIVELRKNVERAASAPFAVLIDGESGSGKELVARAIHRGSQRRQRPFCTLNCAALPDDLVEAELFGHARGAFTGAVADRAGVFEEAHGGTLFLDEIGELAARAQAKVLRVIQEGELRRVGDNLSRRVDVRIVAATNRDLTREVEAGRFRLDLRYRLDVVHITVPPLRDRREDIPLLAEHFWREAAARVGSRAALAAETTAALARYDWPGNVRELQNVLAALAVRSLRRGVVPPSALPPMFGGNGGAGADGCRLEQARRTFEERFVRAALVRTGGHRGRAAAELGVTRQGLTKLLARLGIP